MFNYAVDLLQVMGDPVVTPQQRLHSPSTYTEPVISINISYKDVYEIDGYRPTNVTTLDRLL